MLVCVYFLGVGCILGANVSISGERRFPAGCLEGWEIANVCISRARSSWEPKTGQKLQSRTIFVMLFSGVDFGSFFYLFLSLVVVVVVLLLVVFVFVVAVAARLRLLQTFVKHRS